MKIAIQSIEATLLAILTIYTPTVFAQGSLTPPPGPPAPVMKTLQQIEPRIPIGPDTTPGDNDSLYKISQPGSYYLTGNVAGVSNKIGIEIAASDVTLDLDGFSLIGTTGSYDGVFSLTFHRITVRNGSVNYWGNDGIEIGGMDSRVEHINATGNGAAGIRAVSVQDCADFNNNGAGVVANVAFRVTARYNQNGITAERVVDSKVYNNDGYGITATFVSGSLAVSSGEDGIVVNANGQAIDNLSQANSRHGIRLTLNTRAGGNNCVNNGQSGFGHGIHAESDRNTIVDNSCSENERGIVVTGLLNPIEGNTLLDNDTIGLFVTGQLNIITRNVARNPKSGAVNWNIAAGNRGGIYLAPAQNASAISGATGGSGSGTTDPFANLSF